MKKIKWVAQEESGQGMVEYALIIALVALVVTVGLNILRGSVTDMYNKVSDSWPGSGG